jgi:hypothetical protein
LIYKTMLNGTFSTFCTPYPDLGTLQAAVAGLQAQLHEQHAAKGE